MMRVYTRRMITTDKPGPGPRVGIASTIDRRLLLNYRIDPDIAQRQLPAPFRPQLVGGSAVGGICLIRLIELRPVGAPAFVGLRTENAAHRFSVEWDDAAGTHRGVYIPRRDTSSRLTAALGGRLFEGTHHRARFDVADDGDRVSIRVRGEGSLMIDVAASAARTFESELFGSVAEASTFFREACVGYSPNQRRSDLEGMRLECARWEASALHVDEIHSSVFGDPQAFPPASITFDSGIVMRSLPVRWHSAGRLAAGTDLG